VRLPPPSEDYERAHPDAPLGELLKLLRRRHRVIIWVVVLLTSIATLIGLQTTKTYTATALVVIQPQGDRVVDVEQVVQALSANAEAIETQMKFIQSHENLARTVDELNIYADRTLFPADEGSGGVRGVIAGSLPDEWLIGAGIDKWLIAADEWLIAAGLAKAPGTEANPEELRGQAVEALQGNLKVTQSGRSHILAISYTAEDARRAARLANSIANAYVQGQLEEKLVVTRRANNWLAGRVEELRLQVLDSERAIERYRARHKIAGSRGSSLNAEQIAALFAQLIDGRAEKTAKEAKLRRLKELRGSPNSDDLLADALASPLLIILRQEELELLREEALLSREYGERHPRILQLKAETQRNADRIDQEIHNALRNLENEITVVRSRVEALQQSLRGARGESAVTAQAEVQLRELEREAAANRLLYEDFLMRLKETEEQEHLVQADARVISPAQVPDRPSSPSPQLFAFVGFTGSIVLGSILAVLLEQVDSSLRSTRQIEDLLRVPGLGLVPEVTEFHSSLRQYLTDNPHSAYAEALRALYVRLRLSNIDQPPKVLLVTSALPAEGKTCLAAGLAASASQLQQKTILVDLDLRRPNVGREFSLRSDVGVVELIAGEALLVDAVQRDEESGVDVLGVARRHNNPVALLTSRRLDLLLQELREHYDCVVIDMPPVLGIADATALSQAVDAVVIVLRWERTKRDAARAALKELEDVSANIVGAVLNQVNMKKHAYYGYGDAGQYYGQFSRCYRN
jgi:succinoglycan biosynthesis transport protein ExoP